MLLANSALHPWVESIWGTEIGLLLGGWSFSRDRRWWINDDRDAGDFQANDSDIPGQPPLIEKTYQVSEHGPLLTEKTYNNCTEPGI